MALYPFAAAHLAPDDPSLPPIPEPMCLCGHGQLFHNDVWSDTSVDLVIGGGPCQQYQQCGCAGYRPGGVDHDIAAVRADMEAEFEWAEVA